MMTISENNETFADLLQESILSADIRPGTSVRAKIINITPDVITVSTGLKSDAIINAEEFRGESIQIGDEVNVIVETLEDGFGRTRVSREKARRNEAWQELEKAFSTAQTVMGIVTERVKGGFTVDLKGVRAFFARLFGGFALSTGSLYFGR